MRYCLFLLATLGAAAPVWAENRAVVIGNADYRHAPDLAGSDTPALAEAIGKAGFVTRHGIDLSSADMRRVLDLLARDDSAPGGRVVLLSGRFLTSGDETWFMGSEAQKCGPLGAGGQGVPLSLVMQLMGASGKGGVLLLGTDRQVMPHEQGLTSGIGPLPAVEGVSVLVGSPEAAAKGLRELAAGRTVARAQAAGQGLELLPGGDASQIAARPMRPASPLPEPAESDRADWSQAVQLDTTRAYATYLERNPAGAFAGAARERRAALLLRQQAAAPALPAQAEAALDLDRAARLAVQRELQGQGFDPGRPDGIWGRQTRRALQEWQRRNGHEPTGYLTAAQLAILRHEAAPQAATGAPASSPADPARETLSRLLATVIGYPKVLADRVAGARAQPPASVPVAARQDDLATWRWVRHQDSAAAYQLYLERFPRGEHAIEADQRRVNLLAATEVARRHEAGLGLTPAMRLGVETGLHRAGLDPGPVDGEFSDQTRQALRQYQATRNLRVTGHLSQQTLAELLDSAAQAPASRTSQ